MNNEKKQRPQTSKGGQEDPALRQIINNLIVTPGNESVNSMNKKFSQQYIESSQKYGQHILNLMTKIRSKSKKPSVDVTSIASDKNVRYAKSRDVESSKTVGRSTRASVAASGQRVIILIILRATTL